MTDQPEAPMPEARVVAARRFSFAWLVPLFALVVVGALMVQVMIEKGIEIEILFDEGHGLEPGNTVKFRGVEVGVVREVTLARDLHHVRITAELKDSAAGLAVGGTRFWIVRPQIGLSGVSGVETLLGPNYITLEPGSGGPERQFTGVGVAPISNTERASGLRLILEAERLGSLTIGAPVLYRDIQVGVVTDATLAPDGRSVDVEIEIESNQAHLVRDNSRFWNASGVGVNLGFGGLSVQTSSIQSMLSGGIGFATPKRPGERVDNDHRFELAREVDDDWLDWRPDLSVTSADF